jgi:hypothetical protein
MFLIHCGMHFHDPYTLLRRGRQNGDLVAELEVGTLFVADVEGGIIWPSRAEQPRFWEWPSRTSPVLRSFLGSRHFYCTDIDTLTHCGMRFLWPLHMLVAVSMHIVLHSVALAVLISFQVLILTRRCISLKLGRPVSCWVHPPESSDNDESLVAVLGSVLSLLSILCPLLCSLSRALHALSDVLRQYWKLCIITGYSLTFAGAFLSFLGW